jgi:hypothetical protein
MCSSFPQYAVSRGGHNAPQKKYDIFEKLFFATEKSQCPSLSLSLSIAFNTLSPDAGGAVSLSSASGIFFWAAPSSPALSATPNAFSLSPRHAEPSVSSLLGAGSPPPDSSLARLLAESISVLCLPSGSR